MLETTPLYVKRVDLVVLCGATWETEWPSSFISQFFCSLLSNFLICLHAPFPLSLAGVLLLVLRTQLWITSFYFAARISWFISLWMQSVWTTDRRFRVLRGEACVELVSTDRVQVFSRSLWLCLPRVPCVRCDRWCCSPCSDKLHDVGGHQHPVLEEPVCLQPVRVLRCVSHGNCGQRQHRPGEDHQSLFP